MKRAEVEAFIRRLERARAAVVRGDTGCQERPDKCWACAMQKRSGPGGKDDNFFLFTLEGETGNGPSFWSFNRPKSDTLAMFDNSIAALRAFHSQGKTQP